MIFGRALWAVLGLHSEPLCLMPYVLVCLWDHHKQWASSPVGIFFWTEQGARTQPQILLNTGLQQVPNNSLHWQLRCSMVYDSEDTWTAGFLSLHCYLLPKWTWVIYLTFLCLTFLIWKIGMTVELTSRGCCHNIEKALRLVSDAVSQCSINISCYFYPVWRLLSDIIVS